MSIPWLRLVSGTLLGLAALSGIACQEESSFPKESFSLAQPRGAVTCLAISPDGKYLATGSARLSGNPPELWQGEVVVWDLSAKKQVGSFRMTGWVQSLAFSSDSKFLAAGGGSINYNTSDPNFLGFKDIPGEVRIYDLPNLQERGKLAENSVVSFVRFLPGNKTLLVASYQQGLNKPKNPGRVKALEIPTLKTLWELKWLTAWKHAVALSPDGKSVVVGNYGGVHFIDTATGQKTKNLFPKRGDVELVTYSPDGKHLALRADLKTLGILDVASGQEVTPLGLEFPLDGSLGMAFSPNGRWLAIATYRGGGPNGKSGVLLWDRTGQKVHSHWQRPRGREIFVVAFSPDSRFLAVGSNEGKVRFYNVAK